MRNNIGFNGITTTVANLLIAIIGIHLLGVIFFKTALGSFVYSQLWLDPYLTINSFQIWRLFTYGFIHDLSSPMHVILNCLMIYSMGPILEGYLGIKKFLILIFSSIFVGGLFVVGSFLLGLSSSIVLGFSAASMALLIVWGSSFPNEKIYIFGIFPMSGRNIVFVSIALEIFYSFSSDSISSAAHFGGIINALILNFCFYKKINFKKIFKS